VQDENESEIEAGDALGGSKGGGYQAVNNLRLQFNE
jgi:hypothetical protein